MGFFFFSFKELKEINADPKCQQHPERSRAEEEEEKEDEGFKKNN